VFFLIFKRRIAEKSLRAILFYVIYCILNEGTLVFLHYHHNPDLVFNILAIFTVVEFSFFCLFFYYALRTRLVQNSIPILWLLFLIFATIDFFYINKKNDFDSLTVGVELIVIIILCIYYLAVQLKANYSLSVYSTFDFWVIIAFLIYASGTLFLYLMAENMLTNEKFQMQYTIINASFNILKDMLLAIAMLMKPGRNDRQVSRAAELDNILTFHPKH